MTADHLPAEGQTVTLTLGGPFYGKKLSNAIFRGLATTAKGIVWRITVDTETYQIQNRHVDDWQTTGPKLKVAEIGDAGYVVVTVFTVPNKKPVVEVHGITADAIAAKRESARLRREHHRETSDFGGEGKLEVYVRPILTPAMFGDEQTDEVAS